MRNDIWRRWTVATGCVAALVAAAPLARTQDDGAVKTVTATGEGADETKARDQALRKAVEQGAGVVITSRTETLDFAVAYDRIVARAEGYVKNFTIQESAKDALTGQWKVKLVADVSTGKIQSDWGDIQMMLERKGQPSVVVLVRETIKGRDGATVPAATAYCAQSLESVLQKKGFRVKSVAGLQERERRLRDEAVANSNVAALAAIARDYGANVMISGDMTCRWDKDVDAYGIKMKKYLATASLTAYRTDTADILTSETVSGEASNDGEAKAQEDALKKAAIRISDQMLRAVLNKWYFEFQSGQKYDLEVTIGADDESRMTKAYGYLLKFKEVLKGIKDVSDVSEGPFNKTGAVLIGKLTATSTLSIDQLKAELAMLEPQGYTVELTGADNSSVRVLVKIQ